MKKIFFLAVAISISVGIKAQFFYSDNQQIIKDIVINSFVIVEQSYLLQDTVNHQLFGRNNQTEFGKLRGIAVKTKDGYLISNELLTPWDVDEDCKRYLNQYRGVISKTNIFEISDTIVSQRGIVSRPANSQNQFVSLINDTIFQNNGFKIAQTSSQTEGWLVWLTAKNDIESLKAGDNVTYQIYKKDLNVSVDSICYDVVSPTTENKIIGGLFIVPGQSQIGNIVFNLCGIVINVEGRWKIILSNFNNTISNSATIENEDINLTPVNNTSEPKKKEKKTKKKNSNER